MQGKRIFVGFLFLMLVGFVGAECYDSDGGLNYYENGAVRMYPVGSVDENGLSEILLGERCKDEKTLSEAYCDEGGNPATIDYVCPSKCVSGSRGDVCLRSFTENDFLNTYSSGEQFVLSNGETLGIYFGDELHSLTKLNELGYVLDNPSKTEYDVLVSKHEKIFFDGNKREKSVEVLDSFECYSGLDDKGYSIVKGGGAILKVNSLERDYFTESFEMVVGEKRTLSALGKTFDIEIKNAERIEDYSSVTYKLDGSPMGDDVYVINNNGPNSLSYEPIIDLVLTGVSNDERSVYLDFRYEYNPQKRIDLAIDNVELGVDGDLVSAVNVLITNKGSDDYIAEISDDMIEIGLIYGGKKGKERFILTQLSPKDYCNSSSQNFVLKSGGMYSFSIDEMYLKDLNLFIERNRESNGLESLNEVQIKLYPRLPGYFPQRYLDTDSTNNGCLINDCGTIIDVPYDFNLENDSINSSYEDSFVDFEEDSNDSVYEVFETPDVCNLNNLGYRKSEKYCSEEGFIVQKEGGEVCDNDFECESNSCIDGKCVKFGFWTKVMNWFRRLFS